jgi:predicted RNA-binding protein with TRAM domain
MYGDSEGYGDRDRDRDRAPIEKPVKVGDKVTVEITDVARKGDGIARVNGFVIFVPGANKGDNIEVEITELKNRFAIGKRV